MDSKPKRLMPDLDSDSLSAWLKEHGHLPPIPAERAMLLEGKLLREVENALDAVPIDEHMSDWEYYSLRELAEESPEKHLKFVYPQAAESWQLEQEKVKAAPSEPDFTFMDFLACVGEGEHIPSMPLDQALEWREFLTDEAKERLEPMSIRHIDGVQMAIFRNHPKHERPMAAREVTSKDEPSINMASPAARAFDEFVNAAINGEHLPPLPLDIAMSLRASLPAEVRERLGPLHIFEIGDEPMVAFGEQPLDYRGGHDIDR